MENKDVIQEELTKSRPLRVCFVSNTWPESDSEEVEDIITILEKENVTILRTPDNCANLKIRHFDMVNDKIPFADLVVVIASEEPNCVAATMLAVTKSVPVLILNQETDALPDFYRGLAASRVKGGDSEEYPLYPKMRQCVTKPEHKQGVVLRFVQAFLSPACRYLTHGEFPEMILLTETHMDRRSDVGVGC